MVKQQYIIGFLVLVVLTSSFYIMLPDKVKIDFQKTKTKYFVYEDGWVLGGTEYVYLFDGSKKMRANNRDLEFVIDGNVTEVFKKAFFKDNISLFQSYSFDGGLDEVDMVPVSHVVECINCAGKILHFEYRDLDYSGVTRDAVSPEVFGRFKVEWQEGYDWAKVYQLVSSDKLIIRYRPELDYEVFKVRMFDPVANTTRISPSGTTSCWDSFSGPLIGYCNATDSVNLTYYYQWYKDGESNASGWNNNSGNNFTPSVEYNIHNLSKSDLAPANWTFSCLANNGTDNSSWLNSSDTEIPGMVITSSLVNVSLDTWNYNVSNVTWTNFSYSYPGWFGYKWYESRVEPVNQSTVGYSYNISTATCNGTMRFRNNATLVTGGVTNYYTLWYSWNDSYSTASNMSNTSWFTKNLTIGENYNLSFFLDVDNQSVVWYVANSTTNYSNMTGDFNISIQFEEEV